MDIGSMIKERRAELNLTLEEVGNMVGVGKSTVKKWEDGFISNMRRDKIALLAKALKLNPVSFITGERTELMPLPSNLVRLDTVRYVPLLGKIACGDPILAEENIVDRILLPSHVNATFALTCAGDSMTGAGVDDGDVVFICQQPQVENGEIAAVLISDEATLKKVYLDDNKLTLLPMNPAHDPFVFVGKEMRDIRIIGKAVAVLKNIE